MDKREGAILNRLLQIATLVVSNINERNYAKIRSVTADFEIKMREVIIAHEGDVPLIWKKFGNMTEAEIRDEFNDFRKYPDLESIKQAVKGFLEMRKVSRVKQRDTLIEHILETYRRRQHIGEFG